MFKHKRIAIDFDGTLFHDTKDVNVAFKEGQTLIPKEGAAETTRWLKNLGFELLIFTCRPDYHRHYMEQQIKNSKIEHDYILFYTKPRVDLYIDDKGFRFEDWWSTRRFLEENLYQSPGTDKADQSPDTLYEQHLRNSRLRKFSQLLPYKTVKNVLDVGCARGQSEWKKLPYKTDGFDINEDFLKTASKHGNYNELFNILPDIEKYDAVAMFGILEHLEDPLSFLQKFSKIPRLMITVPNGTSFHRLLGIKIGLLESPSDLSAQDLNVGHHHYFTEATLKSVIDEFCKRTNHKLYEFGSLCLKFAPNSQMSDFRKISKTIDDVAEEINISGPNKFHGAELYAFLGEK